MVARIGPAQKPTRACATCGGCRRRCSCVFLLFSVKTGGGEPNWPVTAYLSGLVLAAAWLARQLRVAAAWCRRWTAAAWPRLRRRAGA